MPIEDQSLAGFPRGFAASGKLFLRPIALTSGRTATGLAQSGAALPLAGGPLSFSAVEVINRPVAGATKRISVPLSALRAWTKTETKPIQDAVAKALDRLSRPRAAIAKVSVDVTRLMGVINVTPDSFFDGGRYADPSVAIARARELRTQGADIIDIGGESTRPGATPVTVDEERRRVIPVVKALAAEGAVVSIDTRHAGIMREAVAAGATIINDVGALAGEGSLVGAARLGMPIVLMHSNADPRTMQENPRYADVVLDVYEYLEARVVRCEAAGIGRERLVVDPGIGFAKTPAHNAAILESLALFHGLGCALLLGASRKSFIAKFSAGEPPDHRLPGSVAAAQWSASQGAQILRVHDVAETRQALAVAATAADPRLLPATA